MPLIYESRFVTPYLVYDAPVDEKTQKVREQFKVDPETGYPEQYNWRNQAKLGPSYKPEDPFIKFQNKPGETYQDTAEIVIGVTAVSALCHRVISYMFRRPWWSKPHHFLLLAGGGSYASYWAQQKSIERQAMRAAAVVDYARQHPERFGEIKRYKAREVLSYWIPRR